MTIVDAHQHFWDLQRPGYSWLAGAPRDINRTFAPDEIAPQLVESGVDVTVAVQASRSDTDYLLALSDAHPFVAAVVGWIPLSNPIAAEASLTRHAAHPKFAGIRHTVTESVDSPMPGLKALAALDLSLDVAPTHPAQLAQAVTLAEHMPELRIVIDHLGKPSIRAHGWQPWASTLARAARLPNVHAKISGLMTEAGGLIRAGDDVRPYVEHALDLFGADRLMAGSDWPVSTLAGSHPTVWTQTRALLAGLSADEQAAILGGTAQRFYRLPRVTS